MVGTAVLQFEPLGEQRGLRYLRADLHDVPARSTRTKLSGVVLSDLWRTLRTALEMEHWASTILHLS